MKKNIKVSWMHCKACELLIETNLNDIDWVKVDSISEKKWEVNIDIDSENKYDEVIKSIKKLWYKIWDEKVNNNEKSIFKTLIIFFIIWIILYLIKDISLFKDLLKTENYSFFIIFLIWIVASMSSCLAITWWIILWFSKYADDSKWIKSHIKVQSMFHIGRIFWYFILWWLLGSLWNFLWWFLWFNKFLLFFAWIIMFYMWLNMLNLVPSITKFWISMPKSLWNKILNIKNPLFAPIVWALTFFLPCWFTQSMQVLAASSWSFMHWALIMWSFAIWTFPILFLVWIWNSYFKDKNLDLVNKIIWVIVVYFWIFILSWFSNMINLNALNNSNENQNSKEEVYRSIPNNVELKEINVVHDWWWFSDVILSWANNYKLIITPESNWLWCMYWLTVPGIDENEYPVKKWVPIVINIKNPKKWTYRAVCTAMWMVHWKIIIN